MLSTPHTHNMWHQSAGHLNLISSWQALLLDLGPWGQRFIFFAVGGPMQMANPGDPGVNYKLSEAVRWIKQSTQAVIVDNPVMYPTPYSNRVHSVYVHSQWEMGSQCKSIFHWLGSYTGWSLQPLLYPSNISSIVELGSNIWSKVYIQMNLSTAVIFSKIYCGTITTWPFFSKILTIVILWLAHEDEIWVVFCECKPSPSYCVILHCVKTALHSTHKRHYSLPMGVI